MHRGDRFFWLALYAQPGLWVGLAIFALVRLESPIWLSLNGECGPRWGANIRTTFFSNEVRDCSHCVGSHNHEHPCFLAVR